MMDSELLIAPMDTGPEYGLIVTVISFVGTALATVYLWRVIRAYRTYHDQRGAISLGKAIGLLVISVGLLISAIGRLLQYHGEFAVLGLSIARGAFLVLILALVLANARPDDD